MASILIVDDEPNIIEVLEILLQDEGMHVLKARTGKEALSVLAHESVDLVISDIRMPDLSGVELLKESRQVAPDTPFIMITAFATTETAIEALQYGAREYVTKPFRMDELRATVRRALEQRTPRPQAAAPKDGLEARHSQKLFQALQRTGIVGQSRGMLEVYRTIGTVANTDSTVLLTGESGTGKELAARAIHEASQRREASFVSINCGAFPETLLESELFGYARGAFTGASATRKGLIELASGGSIFLDEIGEMSTAMQVKLLRVLQERRLRPLGTNDEVPVDVRVIAATNRDLQAAIRQGLFREDLYYRIAVITIPLPPLRARPEDIESLAAHFARRFSAKSGKSIVGFSPEALAALKSYSWPGNVRELENTIERAIALESSETIQIQRLPDSIARPAAPAAETPDMPDGPFDLEGYLAELERRLICRALDHAEGNQTAAAQQLKLTKPSLRHRIQALGIDVSAFRRQPN